MHRFVLAARLTPDGRKRAETLLAEHSALGAEELEAAFDRHAIFLSDTEAIFLFEGEGAHEAVRALFNDPARSTSSAIGCRSSTDPYIECQRRISGSAAQMPSRVVAVGRRRTRMAELLTPDSAWIQPERSAGTERVRQVGNGRARASTLSSAKPPRFRRERARPCPLVPARPSLVVLS